ncbi:MAG: diguanylate cyclase [Firmicutes bacterium]|nr:diguanylate cyclase [Bacillota bacterium]
MLFDVRTIFFTGTITILVNTFILILAWYYARTMRAVLGCWSISLILSSIGAVLFALRAIIPDSLSIIVANICFAGTFVALQEGICRYVGSKPRMRYVMCAVMLVQITLVLYFTYVIPSFFYRVLIFCGITTFYCVLSIWTIHKSEVRKEAPLRLLTIILIVHICVAIFRSVVVEKSFDGFWLPGLLPALGSWGHLAVLSALPLCYFWLVTFRLGAEVREQAFVDSLTGIPNRRAMDKFLNEKLLHGRCLEAGVLWVDIDKFKEINDNYGHGAGDCYLVELSRLICRELRKHDVVFRYGGDEFVIILPAADKFILFKIAERLRKEAEYLSIDWGKTKIKTTVSIGVSVSTDKIKDIDELLRLADIALYKAKRAGGNYAIFDACEEIKL